MSEIRFHPGDPKRKSRSITIGPVLGGVLATALVGAGTLVFLGLLGAPSLVSDLIRSVDRLALHEATRRGTEAFETVGRRAEKLSRQLAADELFLARVGLVAGVPPPAGLPAILPERPAALTSAEMEASVASLARRLRIFELFRRRLATLPEPGGPDPLRIPSRSPVEPSAAATKPISSSSSPALNACAPSGTLQPPPSSARNARSAATARAVGGWSSGATASRTAASSARHSSAIAPCPGAGTKTRGSSAAI